MNFEPKKEKEVREIAKSRRDHQAQKQTYKPDRIVGDLIWSPFKFTLNFLHTSPSPSKYTNGLSCPEHFLYHPLMSSVVEQEDHAWTLVSNKFGVFNTYKLNNSGQVVLTLTDLSDSPCPGYNAKPVGFLCNLLTPKGQVYAKHQMNICFQKLLPEE